MVDFAENPGSQDGHDVDAIIAQAYGQQNPSADAFQQKEAPPQQAPEPSYKEYEFNSRGQPIKIKENDPRFQQWLSQGHDYAQNMGAFKSERQAFDSERQEWEKKWSPYKEIDSFAQQNPDWWKHIDQSYQQKLSSPVDLPEPVKQYLEPILKDYSMMKEFVQDSQRKDLEKQRSDEDAQLDQMIKSIQGKYPDLDFSSRDESGLSLEQRILDFAGKNHIGNFDLAFKAHYYDQAIKQAESRGKESIMQEMQKRKKMGLLDEKPAPNPSSMRFGSDAKSKNWNDLRGEDILKEFKFA
jgi:hypothetical protein